MLELLHYVYFATETSRVESFAQAKRAKVDDLDSVLL
jgi:hypothetical protein